MQSKEKEVKQQLVWCDIRRASHRPQQEASTSKKQSCPRAGASGPICISEPEACTLSWQHRGPAAQQTGARVHVVQSAEEPPRAILRASGPRPRPAKHTASAPRWRPAPSPCLLARRVGDGLRARSVGGGRRCPRSPRHVPRGRPVLPPGYRARRAAAERTFARAGTSLVYCAGPAGPRRPGRFAAEHARTNGSRNYSGPTYVRELLGARMNNVAQSAHRDCARADRIAIPRVRARARRGTDDVRWPVRGPSARPSPRARAWAGLGALRGKLMVWYGPARAHPRSRFALAPTRVGAGAAPCAAQIYARRAWARARGVLLCAHTLPVADGACTRAGRRHVRRLLLRSVAPAQTRRAYLHLRGQSALERCSEWTPRSAFGAVPTYGGL
ncbi:hypothetical protein WOLCODRAFT_150970 [Wolfiporia cocos MD-104 SS10]|uniref:Uncharacterized protein n=1 Tax=Wolfiporia cocos (strain MD-104) TaxID=742152 RepID=A0A2H3JXQ2_WOLCO|nr:hypothetical protein WOLCODRAFT_150970 [Wolfiporia cocos MD-104 SS10]